MILQTLFGFFPGPLVAQVHTELSDGEKVWDGEASAIIRHDEAEDTEQSLAICRVGTYGQDMDGDASKGRHDAVCRVRLPEFDRVDPLSLYVEL